VPLVLKPADASVPWPAGDGWQPLFDGKSLDGWRVVEEASFAQHGAVRVDGDRIVLEAGNNRTGVACLKKVPTTDYEIALEAMRETGAADFCNLVFPVGPAHCALTLGGYVTMAGLDQVDGQPFNENEATTRLAYQRGEWYRILVRVTEARIEAWVGGQKVIDVPREGHQYSLRADYCPLAPVGVSTWDTTGALRNIRFRRLKDGPAAAKP
jgi:hypothetical protein